MTEPRDCLSDRIRNTILTRICDGTYAPGDRLIELQIAREFNSSQAPIREALCKLEVMKVVETEPYKGTRVREIKGRELEESLRIRAVLENLAAEEVGERLLPKIHLLKEIALKSAQAAKNRDLRQYCKINLEFHRMIVEASDNQTLLGIWDSVIPETRMFAAVEANAANLNDGAADHLDIVEAFAEGDNRFAGKLLKKHVESGILAAVEKNAENR